MKIKLIIILLLFSSLLLLGCEISNLNNTKTPVKLTISDIKQLIGVTYDDVEKIYGSPEKSTYYINISNLSSMDKKHISLRDFNYHSIIKAYYDINNNDSYIILWYKDNKVIKSSFYENNVNNEDYFDTKSNNIAVQIDYNKYDSTLNENLIKENYRSYIDKNLKEFNNKYNLSCPKIAVNLLNKNNILYFYNFKSPSNKINNSLFIICHNNIIKDISIIKSSHICEAIMDYIKSAK